jgi:hypothetical protein
MPGVDDATLAFGGQDDAVDLGDDIPFTGSRIYDDAAAVRPGVTASVFRPAAARGPLESALAEPAREIEPLAVLSVRMDPHFLRRRRMEQVHGEGQHDRAFI